MTAAGADTADSTAPVRTAAVARPARSEWSAKYAVQTQTRHKSVVILRRYIRDGSLFRENTAAKVGL